ncbi:MAG: sulfotransferase [Caldilineaceae bacterium]
MIQSRLFLVGYPRSGTTLLQSLIATQPGITSFPESHFLKYALTQPPHVRLLRWGLVSPTMRSHLQQRFTVFLTALGIEQPEVHLPRRSIWFKDYIGAFVDLLDRLTLAQGKTIWLEKTPGHLYHLASLARYVPKVRFIHLIRRGVDAISSYYLLSREHPAVWRPRTIEQLVAEWQEAVQISLQYDGKPKHLLVRYETLVADPPATLQQVCTFIGIPLQAECLQHYPQQAAALSLPHEPWKAGVRQPIVNRNGDRFKQLFTEEQRATIVQALAPIEKRLERLQARA